MYVQADIDDEQEAEHWRKPPQSQSSLMDPEKCLTITETRISSAHKIGTSFPWQTEGTAHWQSPQCNQQLPFPVQIHTNTQILRQEGGQKAYTKFYSTVGNPT